ncbi:serine hydrolase FSH [Aspergillus leporis]|uniref:Serine hydrolase FSH n=1 Tax=Aspergillus leporis TaxID=41062 RepID=A0A5N5XF79_9EURO|nr:serine hydrolase FSH [Aspergillus leporis]
MKILCLHGKGTSGLIFKSQTSSFRSYLTDLPITFNFIDGPHPTTPAPGIDLFYPPPYYTFWETDTVPAVLNARTWLLDYISKNGPYDAVMAFSQGCALAAATLLLHAHETPLAPPPFKAAIFICGGAPLAILEEVGYEIPAEIRDRDVLSRKKLAAQADSKAILAKGAERWSSAEGSGVGFNEEVVRGELGEGGVKIAVPTVHVYGRRDPRFIAGVQLSGVCVGEGSRRVYDHRGGHDIPRGETVSRALADLVRWVLGEGGCVAE